MDVLIYHSEIQQTKFPDSCVSCGDADTSLTQTVLSDTTVSAYTQVSLPFCRKHIKPPLISSSYPGLREFTAEGVIVKNASARFVDAVEQFRQIHPPDLSVTVDLARQAAGDPESARAVRRVAIGALMLSVFLGVAIAGFVVLVNSWKAGQQVETPAEIRTPSEHDLRSDEYGPRGFPERRRSILNP